MNQRSYLRLAIHLAVVAAALGLGAGVRAMLPSRTAAELPATKPPVEQAAPPADAPPLFAADDARPIAGYSPAEMDALRDRIRSLSRTGNPLREQIALRTMLLNGISTVEDFRRALELLESSGAEVYFRQELVQDLAARLAEKDPVAATGATSFIKDRNLRSMAISNIMKGWAQRDPEGALTFVRTQSTGVKSNALNTIFTELAKRDPAAAIARIGEFKEPDFHYGLERSVLSEWWLKDKDAALAWVNSQGLPERKDFMRSLLDVAGNRDPEGAWKLIQALPVEDKPKNWAMGNLLYMWAYKDAGAALNAVLGESDTAWRGETLEQLGRTMKLVDDGNVGKEPGPALLAKITDETLRQRFLYGLAQGYLSDGRARDYRQVLNLAAQLTDDNQRLEMIKGIGGSWGRADAPGASEWLNTLPAGAERDAAIGEFVRGSFTTDPAAALTWSASIADDGKRSRRLTELYPKWVKTDAGAAAAWLSQQTQMSQEDRATLEASAPAP